MFCDNCGCKLADNATFCSKCGKKIKNKNISKSPKINAEI